MSCIIRISGESLDVDALITQSTLQTDRTWKKGEPGRLGKLHLDSGANFVASDSDIDQLQHQITEAEIFLKQHIEEIGLIVAFPGVTHAVIDFGVAFEQESAAVFCHLPVNVVQLVARSRTNKDMSRSSRDISCC